MQPKPNTVAWPHINVWVPFTTFYPATPISLIGFNFRLTPTNGVNGYAQYFRDRWKDGKPFINVEQDIVVWPGAIKQLWDCPHDWCVFDFHLPNHQTRNLENEKVGVPIGCVKITANMIAQTSGLWDQNCSWEYCEQQLTKGLIAAGFTPHQHHPGVVNGNEVFLDFLGLRPSQP